MTHNFYSSKSNSSSKFRLHKAAIIWQNISENFTATDIRMIIKPMVERARGGLVVKALRYKPAGRGFDSRWCHWNFSVT